MSEKDNGGQAFPVSDIGIHGSFGMTLRDYFAARAMQGLISNTRGSFGKGYPQENLNLALASYAIADAMLKARTE